MVTASVAIPEVLLILKIAFLVLLYLFIWRIVRSAARDLRLPQESMILAPQQAAETESPAAPAVEREVAVLSWNGQTKRVEKRRVLLGRSRECDIQLEDPNVSRRHAELRQEGSAFWIIDLDSTNGVEVNGRRVKRARLTDGDTFTMGSTDVTFTTERD